MDKADIRALRGRRDWARVHRVCHYLKTSHGDYDNDCNRCAKWEMDEDYGRMTRGCYAIAEEVCNIAKHGNEWGHPVAVWLWRRWYRLKRIFRKEQA